MREFSVTFTPASLADLADISDVGTRQAIFTRAQKLKTEPLKQGKPLRENLQGLHSVRAAGQRYRVVYRVAVSAGSVTVLVIGIRRDGDRQDVYRLATGRVDD